MCDINDSESLKNSLEWIEEIQARATIHDKVIAVFANKCDQMEDAEYLQFDLEKELYNRYPDIAYEEISV